MLLLDKIAARFPVTLLMWPSLLLREGALRMRIVIAVRTRRRPIHSQLTDRSSRFILLFQWYSIAHSVSYQWRHG